MSRTLIQARTDDPAVNMALDTLNIKKQAILFCNSKRGAEALAERISKKAVEEPACRALAVDALNALSSPTKQCQRLSQVISKGISFHHAGLNGKQREIIEDGFRNGDIKIICATPTLAYGLDMPAFRVIIRDLKRFGIRGMSYIPVLDYEQMSGRAGRPGKEEFGQAIIIAQNSAEKENLVEKYIMGDPEEIVSKLAVEPVLRTYLLSLIASELVNSEESINEFFEKTFYAHQYKNTTEIRKILVRITSLLESWGFIVFLKRQEFVSAYDISSESTAQILATGLGKRVSELYLDPLSANYILKSLENAVHNKNLSSFSFLFMVSRCLEIRPYLRVKTGEYDDLLEKMAELEEQFLDDVPDEFAADYEDYVCSFKTAMFLQEWIDESGEDLLLEKYNIRPGEISMKLDKADWLLYCSEELSRMSGLHELRGKLSKLRVRLKYGAKEELLALLKLRNIGRARARLLYKNGVESLSDLRSIEAKQLIKLIGPALAKNIKSQLGQEITVHTKTLKDYC